ncbi:MAG: hypothetical protein HRU43_06105 [Simkaniaceae bacterium]|nr:hypothetical protein [Simkaniaceae bacterium]
MEATNQNPGCCASLWCCIRSGGSEENRRFDGLDSSPLMSNDHHQTHGHGNESSQQERRSSVPDNSSPKSASTTPTRTVGKSVVVNTDEYA